MTDIVLAYGLVANPICEYDCSEKFYPEKIYQNDYIDFETNAVNKYGENDKDFIFLKSTMISAPYSMGLNTIQSHRKLYETKKLTAEEQAAIDAVNLHQKQHQKQARDSDNQNQWSWQVFAGGTI